MVVGLSRTCLGAVANRAASSSRTACYAYPRFSRGYAAYAHAHAHEHRKEPAPNHPGRKNASAKRPVPPKQKVEAKKPHAKSSDEMTIEQVEEIERVLAFQHLMPTIDPWGQPVTDTLDVMVPRPVTLELAKNPRQFVRTIALNARNQLKSFMALNMLRAADAPPEKDTAGMSIWDRTRVWVKSKRAPRLRKAALLNPIKEVALETYVDLNTALAKRDPKEVARFTTHTYQEQMLNVCKTFKSQNASGKMIWQLHRVLSPVSIVSIRCNEGYTAPRAPRFGNRLMVHALVKFDTEQSLERYDSKGRALHERATELAPQWDTNEKTEPWRVPAQRRRVTEYLVLEKRNWMQTPWQFREQMF